MWRNDFPHERHPFEEDVRDVEEGEKPLVLGIVHVETLAHARRFGISDIGTIEEGHQVC